MKMKGDRGSPRPREKTGGRFINQHREFRGGNTLLNNLDEDISESKGPKDFENKTPINSIKSFHQVKFQEKTLFFLNRKGGDVLMNHNSKIQDLPPRHKPILILRD